MSSFLMSERGNTKKDSRALKIFIILLACVLFLELGYYFVISPNLVIKRILIEAPEDFELSNSAILQLAGIGEDREYLQMDTVLIRDRIESYHSVLSAEVTKIFPDTLKIVVELRSPVVVALVDMANESLPVAIDANGVIFQIGDEIQRYMNDGYQGVATVDSSGKMATRWGGLKRVVYQPIGPC